MRPPAWLGLFCALGASSCGGAAGAQTPAAAASPAAPAVLPCGDPMAVALVDRPGTGRNTTNGGSPCVVLPGGVVVEAGYRRQVTSTAGAGRSVLTSLPLAFVRVGIAGGWELGIAPPAVQSRSAFGTTPVDTAHGLSDTVVALKYLVLDTPSVQGSAGAAYSAPTGTGEFTAGAPTFSLSANLGVAVTPRLALAVSEVPGTGVGPDAVGAARRYFVNALSFTLALTLDGSDTLLVQDALTSRQGPVLPAGNRGFLALQRALNRRFAVDVDYEMNLAPALGAHATALGFGFVWIAQPGSHR